MHRRSAHPQPRWLALFSLAVLAFPGCQPIPPGPEARPDVENELFIRANQVRVQSGRPPLQRRADLDKVARAYAEELAHRNTLDHVGKTGESLSDRIGNARIRWLEVGENLARNKNVPDPVATVLNGWDKSPTHRQHLLNPDFRQTGVGVAHDPDTGMQYFVQLYLLPR